jgi:hypothetical protein
VSDAQEGLNMDDEFEIIADENGIALIGDGKAIDRFLSSNGCQSTSMDLERFSKSNIATGTSMALKGGEAIATSGRWVKLTSESAKLFKHSQLMQGSAKGLVRGQAMNGAKFGKHLEILKSSGHLLTNPAVLAGVGGIMAQYAMQQAMDEIMDYLAVIDKKVDSIIRSQKDAAIAELIGVGFVVDEAYALRNQVSRVSDITWSKVQNTTFTIAKTQAYALRQLDGIASRLEREKSIGELDDLMNESKIEVEEWLAVLARCFQLQDAVAVLELDRVFDSSPDELDNHREALRLSREARQTLIADTTRPLVNRMDAVAEHANKKVLLHPLASKTVVATSNEVAHDVVRFQTVLGIEQDHQELDARKWGDAANELKDDVVDKSAAAVEVVARVGAESLEQAKKTTKQVSKNLGDLKDRVLKKKSED